MLHRITPFLVGFLALAAFNLSSCKEPQEAEPVDTFDKEAMLANLADELIVPAYESAASDAEVLKAAVDAFEAFPSAENLDAAREACSALQLQWQSIAPYELGPAADENLRRTVNTFPADTTQIERNIREQLTDLSTASNTDAKGLPALDYLLFGPRSHGSNWSADRLIQVRLNAELVFEEISAVNEAWKTSYRDEFVRNLGNDVGSSLGQLVNELNYEFELVKNARVGIPLGKKSLGVPQEEKVEAYYAEQSLANIEAALNAQKNIFRGADGLGLDDYLDHLDARYGEGLLSTAIIEQFDEVLTSTASISEPLPEAIQNNPGQVDDLHTKLQNLVVLLKTDMPSQLGVQITYQDNDGD
jgi:hypothetical protein